MEYAPAIMSKSRRRRLLPFALVPVLTLLAPRLAMAQDSPPAPAGLPSAEEPGTNPPILTLATGPVLVVGYMDELVYRDSTTTELLSKLRWQLLPAAGLRLDAVLSPRWKAPISFALSVTSLFPTVTGTMVDEDWDVGTLVYGRSEHQAQLARGMDATMIASWSWPDLGLRLGAGAAVSDLSWEGWDGSAIYKYSTYTSTLTFSGIVIAYRALRIGPALDVDWEPSLGGFDFRIGIELRYHALQWGVDSHLARQPYAPDTTFFDVMAGGFALNPSVSASRKLAPGLTTSVHAAASVERWARGDDYAIEDDGTITLYEGIAGQEFTAFSLSFLVRVER